MHILRVATFVSPTSGGIKTALRHWGEAYLARGHEVSLVIPGPGPPVTQESQGRVHRVPAVPVPGSGYSLVLARRELRRLVAEAGPDVVEVSDRSTLRWVGPWARQHRIASVMVSHEHLTGILRRRTPLPARSATRVADLANRRSARYHDAIACPSAFAAEEFTRIGVPAQVVPLGVDLDVFTPTAGHGPRATDAGPRHSRTVELVHCGRLSPEKNPWLSVATLRVLVGRGVDAHLTVLGHGPLRERMRAAARGLPVTFHPYVADRPALAAVLAVADVAIAPGPVETFGLAALEALACGVPTVCPDEGALQEVVGTAGVVAASEPARFADGVLALLQRPKARQAARERAERFTWGASADLMLGLHEQLVGGRRR